MKKLLFCILFCIACSTFSVQAGTCEGGKEITGKNGHVYCMSDELMNWWSAFQWCEAQGRHFATPDEACNYGKIHWGGGSCGNIKGIQHETGKHMAWLAMAKDSNFAYGFNLGNGDIGWSWLQRSGIQAVALCY